MFLKQQLDSVQSATSSVFAKVPDNLFSRLDTMARDGNDLVSTGTAGSELLAEFKGVCKTSTCFPMNLSKANKVLDEETVTGDAMLIDVCPLPTARPVPKDLVRTQQQAPGSHTLSTERHELIMS